MTSEQLATLIADAGEKVNGGVRSFGVDSWLLVWLELRALTEAWLTLFTSYLTGGFRCGVLHRGPVRARAPGVGSSQHKCEAIGHGAEP